MEIKMQSKSKKIIKLLENDLFQELIIEDYVKGGIAENVLTQSLNADNTIDELKARQILHRYLFGIIERNNDQ